MSNPDRHRPSRSGSSTGPRGRQASGPNRPRGGGGDGGGLWFYGRHAVEAALANPARSLHRLVVAERSEAAGDPKLAALARGRGLEVETVSRADIDRRFGEDAVHQGIALHLAPLPERDLEATLTAGASSGTGLIVVLDQVTDPHNVGAILRAAAAFGAVAVVMTERRAAPESAVLAKAASGTLETVPLIRIGNLARALDDLKRLGWWCVGLDGHATADIRAPGLPDRLALVMGAEGPGLRRLTRETCDLLVRLPISDQVESLNVATATAVALYALGPGRTPLPAPTPPTGATSPTGATPSAG